MLTLDHKTTFRTTNGIIVCPYRGFTWTNTQTKFRHWAVPLWEGECAVCSTV